MNNYHEIQVIKHLKYLPVDLLQCSGSSRQWLAKVVSQIGLKKRQRGVPQHNTHMLKNPKQ